MKKIGIVGGGQLGKMMILAAKYLDYYFVILDPTEHCPAHSIADQHIIAGFDDMEAMLELGSRVDVITYEFEHINVKALQAMEEKGYKVYPSSETLLHIQNKKDQKDWLRQHGLPVPDYMEITGPEDLLLAGEKYGYPYILKTCTGGYDGKGNAVVESGGKVTEAYESLGAGKLPLMAEEWVPFEKEVSILVCQSANGEVAVFPVAENIHKDSILDETTVPAVISESAAEQAMDIAKRAVKAFHACGMLCIELFVTGDQKVLVNELAPRPHNSGHYTIEGCYTSQYENHIRAIMGLPLGNPGLIRPTAMKNILGTRSGEASVQGLEDAYKFPDLKVHIYGKEKVSPGRKMGHLTATGETLEAALDTVRKAHDLITF